MKEELKQAKDLTRKQGGINLCDENGTWACDWKRLIMRQEQQD